MKKFLSMVLICSLLCCCMIAPALAYEYNPADSISFKPWYITVKSDKIIIEGTIVNDNNGGAVTNFKDFMLALYYNGEEIFEGCAGEFTAYVRAGNYKRVKLTFTPSNCWCNLEEGRYDVRGKLTSDIGFTCTYKW